jgi:uncharacterized membrane protein
MINADTNVHILHRALTGMSSNADRGESEEGTQHEEPQQSEQQPKQPEFIPVSPLLPRGLEYEVPPLDDDFDLGPAALAAPITNTENGTSSNAYNPTPESKYTSKDYKLLLSFVLLVIAGAGNVVSAKLQAVSMYNYGVFLSLFSYVIYVPICFAFIIPVSKYGWFNNAITAEHWLLSKRPFAIMGGLDCLSAVMQTFASIYLPGPLLVLLPQAAIPLSMLLTKHMLGERYRKAQYVGATVVFVGLLVVLEPVVTYRRAPAYICEAVDLKNHCTICSMATTEEACIHLGFDMVNRTLVPSQSNTPSGSNRGSFDLFSFKQRLFLEVQDDGKEDPFRPGMDTICEWVPLEEASTGKEFSVFVWSIVMVLSCVPMTLSRCDPLVSGVVRSGAFWCFLVLRLANMLVGCQIFL